MKRKHSLGLPVILGMLIAATVGCSDQGILSPDSEPRVAPAAPVFTRTASAAEADDQACWGQATRVFAALGVMGEHASYYETPREGLRNLARSLYADGVLPDDSMQALGAFVATIEGLSIDACL